MSGAGMRVIEAYKLSISEALLIERSQVDPSWVFGIKVLSRLALP